MKGELAVCASPKCNKEFIKTRVNQNCCGNASCRTLYNRFKNGQPLVPESFNRSRKVRSRATVGASYNRNNNGAGFSQNLANGVLTGAVGPAISNAIGRGTFVGNVAASAVSSAVIPLVRDFINSGNKIQFSSIDDDMNYWIRQKEHWIKQREKIDKGILPIKSIGGSLIGGVLGYMSVNKPSKIESKKLSKEEKKKLKKLRKKKKREAKRNAIIGGIILGGFGGYLEYTERNTLNNNAQALADNADLNILEAEQNIERLRHEKATMKNWVDEDILVEDNEGTYSVNPDVFNSIMTANDYKSVKIPQIEFKGAFKLLLSKARNNFYKLVGGLPEQGKTSYCVKFATYYAQHHGKVLYIPAEQSGTNADFQEVLNRVGANGFDIDVSAHKYNLQQLLAKIKGYDLVILDSIQDMRLSPTDVKTLNERVAILGVMQSTKAGGFKGGQDYLHDCDKFILIDKLTASASKSRGTNPQEDRERIPINKLIW